MRSPRRASNAATGTPPIRAEDHRNTCEVPGAPIVIPRVSEGGGSPPKVLAGVTRNPLPVEMGPWPRPRRAGPRLARDVGERIGRIGDHQKYRVGLRPYDPRDDIAIDFG